MTTSEHFHHSYTSLALALLATILASGCGSVLDPDIDRLAQESCAELASCEMLAITEAECVNERRARIGALPEDQTLDYLHMGTACTKLSTCAASVACLEALDTRYLPRAEDAAARSCERLAGCELIEAGTEGQCALESAAAVAALPEAEAQDYIRQADACVGLSTCEASAACLDDIVPRCEPTLDHTPMNVAMDACTRLVNCGITATTLEECVASELAHMASLCPAQAEEYRVQARTCVAIEDCTAVTSCITSNF